MVDVNLESEEGAQAKADQAQSNAESFAASEVESHRSTETHDTAQPPQSHDNEAHDRDFVDGGEAAAAAPVQSVNGETGAITVSVGSQDRASVIASDSEGIPSVEAAVELFLEDKDPRGEAFETFLLSFPDTEAELSDNVGSAFVLDNKGQFSSREDNPTPDDFSQAYVSMGESVALTVAYIELFLSDITTGEEDLEIFMGIDEIADDLANSKQAMRVITQGEDFGGLVDYRA